MPHDRRGVRILLLVALPCALLLLGFFAAQAPGPRATIYTGQGGTETPTPDYIQPIFSSADAIARSLARFPIGRNPHGEVARLTTYEVLDAWRDASSPGLAPQSPVWLVGVLGDGVTKNEALWPSHLYGDDWGTVGTPPHDRPVDGAFYAWDANGGVLVGEGVLDEQGDLSYSTLTLLPDMPLTVEPATEVPTSTPDGTATD